MKKKKVIIAIVIVLMLLSAYVYNENRYVQLYPVVVSENSFKILDSNSVPKTFYKNAEFVLKRYDEDFVLHENGTIFVKKKKMDDLELIYNYTKKANDSIWLKDNR